MYDSLFSADLFPTRRARMHARYLQVRSELAASDEADRQRQFPGGLGAWERMMWMLHDYHYGMWACLFHYCEFKTRITDKKTPIYSEL